MITKGDEIHQWPLTPPPSLKSKITLVTKVYNHGDIIIQEGAVGNKVCFLQKGRCKIYTTGFNGQILIQNVVEAPEVFGMIEQFGNYPNVCTVEAFGSASTQEISTADYLEWIATDNTFALAMLKRVSAIAYNQIERQSTNILSPLKQRFLGYLIAHYEGQDRFSIEKVQLAQILATTVRHLNRTIKQCEQAQVLSYTDGKLAVVDWHSVVRFKDL